MQFTRLNVKAEKIGQILNSFFNEFTGINNHLKSNLLTTLEMAFKILYE